MLKTYKFAKIVLKKTCDSLCKVRVFLHDYIILHQASKQLFCSNVTLPFYYVIILVVQHSKMRSGSCYYSNSVKYSSKKVTSSTLTSKGETIHHLSCSASILPVHKAYSLETETHSEFILVKLKQFSFNGTKMVACLHGGMSFYEFELYKKATLGKEIINLCSNSSSHEDKESELIYASASTQLLIVLYTSPHSSIQLQITWSSSFCRGVFINPCKGNQKYVILPPKNMMGINHVPCFFIQIGPQISDSRYKRGIQLGCEASYRLKPPPGEWSTILLHASFSGSIGSDLATFVFQNTEDKEGNKSGRPCQENLAKFAESAKLEPKSEWFWGYKTDNLPQKNLRTGLTKSSIKTKLRVSSERVTNSKLSHLFLTVNDYSESVLLLKLHFTKETTEVGFIQTKHRMFNLNQPGQFVCLRKHVQGLLDNNIVLSLGASLKKSLGKCSVGKIMMSSNLCLEYKSLLNFLEIDSSMVKHLLAENIFRVCVTDPNRTRADTLMWTAELYSNLFAFASRLLISVPGKITDAKLFVDSNSTCAGSIESKWQEQPEDTTDLPSNIEIDHHLLKCMPLFYLSKNIRQLGGFMEQCKSICKTPWGYKDRRCLDRLDSKFKKNEKMRHPPFELLSRDLYSGWTKPDRSSWFDAKQICAEIGSELPSIFSENDIKQLAEYIKLVSFTLLVAHVFLGIHKKVILQVKFKKCFPMFEQ